MLKKPALLPILTLILLLAACNPATPAATPTPTPEILSDCFWSATALAFLDTNQNGRPDPGEPPLPEIEFILDPTVYSRTTSGEDGVANIFATTPNAGSNISCEQMTVENPLSISAVKFEGYQLTTPQTIAYIDTNTQYHFGFIASPEPVEGEPVEGEPVEGEPAEGTPTSDPSQTTSDPVPGPNPELVSGPTGLALSPNWPVAQVNYLFEWYGEAWPIWEYEQFVSQNGRYLRTDQADFTPQIKALIASINSLTPAESVQYTNLWTDDYPQWYIELVSENGQRILIYSESTGFRGHAPWYILIDDQLYRQTTGDIGFALHDLASEYAQDYFSLDEQPFDESLLEPPGRPYIYRTYHNFTGLLPIAKTFNYEYFIGTLNLTGLFIWDPQDPQTEHSSQPLTAVEAIQLTLPDGTTESCTFESEPDVQNAEWTWHNFSCPYNSNEEQTVTIHITFATADGGTMTVDGRLNPLGFILPMGIPPSE